MSSVVFPWIGTYAARDLPQFKEIQEALLFAGDLARMYDQRVTFHPTHFVKLATNDGGLAGRSRQELEGHSEILDLMGCVRQWCLGMLDLMGCVRQWFFKCPGTFFMGCVR